jgi:hypothetical protein
VGKGAAGGGGKAVARATGNEEVSQGDEEDQMLNRWVRGKDEYFTED